MPIYLHRTVTAKYVCAKNIALVANVIFVFTTAREDKKMQLILIMINYPIFL